MQQRGELLLANCSNESLGLHLAVQMNNSLKSQRLLRTLQAVIFLLVGFGKMIVALQ